MLAFIKQPYWRRGLSGDLSEQYYWAYMLYHYVKIRHAF
jgi:hypothetical protein